jgi:hypothetical protein
MTMHDKDNATDAGCEMDREPYRGLPWDVVLFVLGGAVVWVLAGIGAGTVIDAIKGAVK